jgi:hypothetical protein
MKNKVIVHRLYEDKTIFKIVPMRLKRDWMTDSKKKIAYKCLPLNIANQYGWAVLSPVDFSIVWWGGKEPSDVEIIIDDPNFDSSILSYFGESVFTLHPDFILQTPENFSTYIRGIPNEAMPGIKPLDAIVETDWLPFTFTYNFQMLTPGVYEFKKGDPLFCFFPIERNTVENFKLVESYIEKDKEFFEEFDGFSRHATERMHDEHHHRLYIQGKSPRKQYNIKNHITSLLFGGKSDKI